jgi:hypothetical protein
VFLSAVFNELEIIFAAVIYKKSENYFRSITDVPGAQAVSGQSFNTWGPSWQL